MLICFSVNKDKSLEAPKLKVCGWKHASLREEVTVPAGMDNTHNKYDCSAFFIVGPLSNFNGAVGV